MNQTVAAFILLSILGLCFNENMRFLQADNTGDSNGSAVLKDEELDGYKKSFDLIRDAYNGSLKLLEARKLEKPEVDFPASKYCVVNTLILKLQRLSDDYLFDENKSATEFFTWIQNEITKLLKQLKIYDDNFEKLKNSLKEKQDLYDSQKKVLEDENARLSSNSSADAQTKILANVAKIANLLSALLAETEKIEKSNKADSLDNAAVAGNIVSVLISAIGEKANQLGHAQVQASSTVQEVLLDIKQGELEEALRDTADLKQKEMSQAENGNIPTR